MNTEQTPIHQLEAIKSHLRHHNLYANGTITEIRNHLAESAAGMLKHSEVTYEAVSMGSLYAEWIVPHNISAFSAKKAILYFHGGGFVAGTCDFYRDLCTRISLSAGMKLLIVEYRLAPEYRYPAANKDCFNAYRWLLAKGYAADDIVLGGDSVGGSLVLMTLLSLRDAGQPLPAGAFLLSPHSDLVHFDGESYISRSELDPTGSQNSSQRILRDYCGDQGELDELLSPLRMNLAGLPELYIQVGDHEVLLSDALRLKERAETAGVKVELEVWENLWSVFQFMAPILPEARQAIERLGRFIQSKV